MPTICFITFTKLTLKTDSNIQMWNAVLWKDIKICGVVLSVWGYICENGLTSQTTLTMMYSRWSTHYLEMNDRLAPCKIWEIIVKSFDKCNHWAEMVQMNYVDLEVNQTKHLFRTVRGNTIHIVIVYAIKQPTTWS